MACDLAIRGDRSLVETMEHEDVTYLQAQRTVFYLSCASGDHKGHLLREISGELQEVNPKERHPGWKAPVSTKDEEGLQAALVTGQKALGEGHRG